MRGIVLLLCFTDEKYAMVRRRGATERRGEGAGEVLGIQQSIFKLSFAVTGKVKGWNKDPERNGKKFGRKSLRY